MYSTITDPTVGTFAEFTVERTDVLTTDIHTPTGHTMEDTLLTIMEDIIAPTIPGLIVGMCVEFIVVHIEGVITDAYLQ
jgi:hypothetical protein